MPQTILAIDCSTGPASIALMKNGQTLAEHVDAEGHKQSARLVPAVQALVEQYSGGFAAIDLFAVTTGPGGFTGIRIALAAARGFALATSKPIIGISSLETLAYEALMNAAEDETALAVINAHRSQYYIQLFIHKAGGMHPAGEAQAINISALDDFIKAHRPTRIVSTVAGLGEYCPAPQAKYAALFAASLPESTVSSRPASALYIRPPDAKPQKPLLA